MPGTSGPIEGTGYFRAYYLKASRWVGAIHRCHGTKPQCHIYTRGCTACCRWRPLTTSSAPSSQQRPLLAAAGWQQLAAGRRLVLAGCWLAAAGCWVLLGTGSRYQWLAAVVNTILRRLAAAYYLLPATTRALGLLFGVQRAAPVMQRGVWGHTGHICIGRRAMQAYGVQPGDTSLHASWRATQACMPAGERHKPACKRQFVASGRGRATCANASLSRALSPSSCARSIST